jgi:hypothetical protein
MAIDEKAHEYQGRDRGGAGTCSCWVRPRRWIQRQLAPTSGGNLVIARAADVSFSIDQDTKTGSQGCATSTRPSTR